MPSNTNPHQPAEMSKDSETQGLAGVVYDPVPQGPADVVYNADPYRSAGMANISTSEGIADVAVYNGNVHRPAEMPNDSTAQVLADMTYDSVLQGPADMVRSVEPSGPAEVANDTEMCERTDGDFCEFQYIEIIPLDSPKEAAQTNENCSNEVKEEIKQEPEDVCNIYFL